MLIYKGKTKYHKENTDALLDASEETGKYMLMYRHQNEQNHNMQRANSSFKNEAKFTYLGMTITNKNWKVLPCGI
jgi:hypothetical protein